MTIVLFNAIIAIMGARYEEEVEKQGAAPRFWPVGAGAQDCRF